MSVETKTIGGMEFKSIAQENYRVYHFTQRTTFRIDDPEWLYVRPSGSHMVVDKSGKSYYVPNTFIAIEWFNPDGEKVNF